MTFLLDNDPPLWPVADGGCADRTFTHHITNMSFTYNNQLSIYDAEWGELAANLGVLSDASDWYLQVSNRGFRVSHSWANIQEHQHHSQ